MISATTPPARRRKLLRPHGQNVPRRYGSKDLPEIGLYNCQKDQARHALGIGFDAATQDALMFLLGQNTSPGVRGWKTPGVCQRRNQDA